MALVAEQIKPAAPVELPGEVAQAHQAVATIAVTDKARALKARAAT